MAIAALIMATTGTAMAAGHLVKGDKLIKPHSLSGNRLRAHTVTRAQINLKRLGTVPKAKTAATATRARTLPPLVWHSLALENGWADNLGSSSVAPPAFAVDAQRIVHLRGQIDCSTIGCAALFAVLPAGFRPNHSVDLAVDTADSTTGRIDVEPSGDMTVSDPDSDGNSQFLTSLDGLTYALG